MRTDGVHCRESAGSGPAVLKVVPVTGAAFSGFTINHFLCASLFQHPLLVCSVDIRDTECDTGTELYYTWYISTCTP